MANGMKRAIKKASVADEAPNFAAMSISLKIPVHRVIKTVVNIMPVAVEIRCLLTELSFERNIDHRSDRGSCNIFHLLIWILHSGREGTDGASGITSAHFNQRTPYFPLLQII